MSEPLRPLYAKLSLYEDFAENAGKQGGSFIAYIPAYGTISTVKTSTIDVPFKLFGITLPMSTRRETCQRTVLRDRISLYYRTQEEAPPAALTLHIPIEAMVALHSRVKETGKTLNLTNPKIVQIQNAAARSGLTEHPPENWPQDQRLAHAQKTTAQFFASLPDDIFLEPPELPAP